MNDNYENGSMPENDNSEPENEEKKAQDEETALQYDKHENKETENIQGSGKRFIRELFDWLETFAFAFAFVLIIFTFLLKIVTVDGHSMEYTLSHGDRLIISDVMYEPKYGDIVVILNERTQKPIIKRVIATEGQNVEINFNTWEIMVDGVLLDEPYINDEAKIEGKPLISDYCVSSFTVGENQVFAMGDNRNNSSDSRFYGNYTRQEDGSYIYTGFSEDDILGRVLLRITPLKKFGAVN
jgi:signal peptidase I